MVVVKSSNGAFATSNNTFGWPQWTLQWFINDTNLSSSYYSRPCANENMTRHDDIQKQNESKSSREDKSKISL